LCELVIDDPIAPTDFGEGRFKDAVWFYQLVHEQNRLSSEVPDAAAAV
jgi:hypothetical protein